MNNQLRITYNPYAKTIAYEYQSKPDESWKNIDRESDLSKFREGALQNYSEEIVRTIIKEFCTDGKGVDLIFRGTRLDWEDLKEIVRQIDSEHRIHCLDSTSEEMISADNALAEVEKIFRELSDQFEASQDLDVKRCIDQYLDATRPEIVLVAVGAYSAGKSSFINALVGEELLPTADDPLTARIFKISSQPEGMWYDTKIHFKYGTQDVELYFNEQGYCLDNPSNLPNRELKYCLDTGLKGTTPSPQYVYKLLSILNDFNSGAGEKADVHISELIEIETPFYHSTLPLDRYQFTIYDTPGFDSSSHPEHREIMKKALKDQTNGVSLLLTKREDMDKEAVKELRNQLSGIKALDESNIMIIVNKADENGDSSLSKIRDRKTTAQVAQKGAENRVFVVSSLVGLGAKKANMAQCVFSDIAELFDEKKSKFLNGTKKLFIYDALPQYRYNAVCKEGERANTDGNDQARLFHNSGMWAVESEITRFAEKYAAFNKCKQAQRYMAKSIDLVVEEKKSEEISQQKLVEALVSRMGQKKQELLQKLKKQKDYMCRTGIYEEFVSRTSSVLNQCLPDNFEEELLKEIQAQWKITHKNEDKMSDWVWQTIQDRRNSFKNQLTYNTKIFWEQKTNFYKEHCIRLVKDSEALSTEEKSTLEHLILNYPLPAMEEISFDFDIHAKTERGFWFWRSLKFDAKKCAESMGKQLKKVTYLMAQQYPDGVQRTVLAWIEDFYTCLVKNCEEFNPTLRELHIQLADCEEKKQRLEELRRKIEKEAHKIEVLLIFQEMEEVL